VLCLNNFPRSNAGEACGCTGCGPEAAIDPHAKTLGYDNDSKGRNIRGR
jgi:hypothetical protein